MIDVRPATIEDAASLAPRLRQADRNEIKALSGAMPGAVLVSTVRRSTEAFVIEIDGRVEALFGYRAPPSVGGAMVWAMGTDQLPRYRKSMIKAMAAFLDDIEARYGSLTNIVDEANTASIRLLRALGFSVGLAGVPMPGGGRGLVFWRGAHV